MSKQIEILAPAGSYESMRAAMNAGCDAVYIGGSSFGARAYADNPDEEALLRAIDEAHIRDKRLYLTVNTLIKEDERARKLYNFLSRFYREGLDAVIVQDVGAMNFIHRYFPELPMHASTQTTVTMAQGAQLLKAAGVTRLVMARELPISEIREMHANIDMELEAFVHGALCYCYSGQCLMSSLIGGRSGNRGRCAQPCRMPYQFFSGDRIISDSGERYLLSTKDINTIALIPELLEAGVTSLKIEGRMKSPEYSAGVSALYRKYTDIYYELGRERYLEHLKGSGYRKDMNNLLDLYNRGGFSEGYGRSYHGRGMMSMYRPNHSGIRVGSVSGIKKGMADIILIEDVNAQDILEIRKDDEEKAYEFTTAVNANSGSMLRVNTGSSKNSIRAGLYVYRTRNNKLLSKLALEYSNKDKRTYISGKLNVVEGEKLQLMLMYKDIEITVTGVQVQTAVNKPMTEDMLSAPVKKLGDTLFAFSKLEIVTRGSVFVPVLKLNELRRKAIDKLQDAILGIYRREPTHPGPSGSISSYPVSGANMNREHNSSFDKEQNIEIVVCVTSKEQLEAALQYKEVSSVYLDYAAFGGSILPVPAQSIRSAGKSCYVMLPIIIRPSLYKELKTCMLSLLESEAICGFIVRNFEGVALLKDLSASTGINKEIILNHNMYIFNRDSKDFWEQRGISHYTAPLELNYKELAALKVKDCDLMVYGYMPVMVSAQCLYESMESCSRCDEGVIRPDYLLDRTGRRFYVHTECRSCVNIIYNGQCLSLLRYYQEVISLQPSGLRLDFTMETGEETDKVLKAFISTFVYGEEQPEAISEYTTGHFKRGVL